MPASGFLLRVYGLPRIDDEPYVDVDVAIDAARQILLEHGAPGYFCELQGRNGVLWTAYFADGQVIEAYQRPPQDVGRPPA